MTPDHCRNLDKPTEQDQDILGKRMLIACHNVRAPGMTGMADAALLREGKAAAGT